MQSTDICVAFKRFETVSILLIRLKVLQLEH